MPKQEIDRLISAASTIATTPNPDPLGIRAYSDERVAEEIAECVAKAASVPAKVLRPALKRLEKHRKEIAAVYGVMDISGALDATFTLPCDLELTFDTPALIANWQCVQKATGAPGLPRAVLAMAPELSRVDHSTVRVVLGALVNATARVGLAQTTIGYYTLLRELEACVASGKLPTPGVTLDVDHAIGALAHNVFVCRDQKLLKNTATFLRGLSLPGHDAVGTGKALKKAIAKPI